MKSIIEQPATGNTTGPAIGLLKAINLPHPDSPDKQRITITDGQKDLDCNIIGKHIHVPHDKVGQVIKIEWDEAKTGYVTVFPDGGRCLTLRDGVRYSYREPKAGTVPTAEDRVLAMAKHYAYCFQMAQGQLKKVCPEITIEAVQPVATVLFLDTKFTVKVEIGGSDKEPLWEGKPKEKIEIVPDEPTPPFEPAPWEAPEEKAPEPAPEPEPVKEQIPILLDKDHDALLKLPYHTFIEKMRMALLYNGKDGVKVAWRSLFVKVADSYVQASVHPKVWMDLYDEIWQRSSDAKQAGMDAMIAEAVEKQTGATDSVIHRAVCILSGTIKEE